MKPNTGTTTGEEKSKDSGFSYKTTGLVIIFVCSLFIVSPTSRSSSFLENLTSTSRSRENAHRVEELVRFWDESYFQIGKHAAQDFDRVFPAAPYIQNCARLEEETTRLDKHWNGRAPDWIQESTTSTPPWVGGGDGDNLPLTRRVQTDIWLHQHPNNCSDPALKFLVASFETHRGLGVGAQIVAMCGTLATALNEGRILVIRGFNRAKHEGCKGSSYGRWSCYFAQETSDECLARATELQGDERAWQQGIITGVSNYSGGAKWKAVPNLRLWGTPWERMQPFDVVNGRILGKHKAMDRQWWRAQALRYLIRFPSQYTCSLLNQARHQSFGKAAGELTLKSSPWPKVYSELQGEKLVWGSLHSFKPWIPRPILSIHVRQGDKGSEMQIFNFTTYMLLAEEIRSRFPEVQSIWLSTEMQTVVEEASYHHPRWKFYYTSVPRQIGTTKMSEYEESLGRKESSRNAVVNLLMAAECDFFVGALGSTWSYLLDGLRLTGGKRRSGFLSVNVDRYW